MTTPLGPNLTKSRLGGDVDRIVEEGLVDEYAERLARGIVVDLGVEIAYALGDALRVEALLVSNETPTTWSGPSPVARG